MYDSLVGRDLEHEIVPLCRDAGMAVMVWSPLTGGLDFIPDDREHPRTLTGSRRP